MKAQELRAHATCSLCREKIGASRSSDDGARMKKLTLQQRKFVDALFKTTPPMNASEAARVAGVSQASCRVTSSKWLTKPNLIAEIEKRRKAIEDALDRQADVTREQWVRKMRGFFHADVRKMFTGPGNAIDIHELGDNEALMVEGYELVENFTKVGDQAEHTGYTKKVKLTPKLKAMLEFGKVMGWYAEKKDNDGTFTLEQLIDAMEKVKA